MKAGEKARLFISPEFGYGIEGYPPVIPPSSPLIFDVELLGVHPFSGETETETLSSSVGTI